MDHTKEPWAQNGHRIESRDEHGVANDGWIIAQCEGMDAEANVRRIIACVNACAGVDTHALECITILDGSINRRLNELLNADRQRDCILTALKLAQAFIAEDRQALLDCYTNQRTGAIDDPIGLDALEHYDAVLSSIDAAIAK